MSSYRVKIRTEKKKVTPIHRDFVVSCWNIICIITKKKKENIVWTWKLIFHKRKTLSCVEHSVYYKKRCCVVLKIIFNEETVSCWKCKSYQQKMRMWSTEGKKLKFKIKLHHNNETLVQWGRTLLTPCWNCIIQVHVKTPVDIKIHYKTRECCLMLKMKYAWKKKVTG